MQRLLFETSRISSDEDWLMISNNEVFRMKNEVVPVCIRWFESNKLGDFASSSLKGEERRHLRRMGSSRRSSCEDQGSSP